MRGIDPRGHDTITNCTCVIQQEDHHKITRRGPDTGVEVSAGQSRRSQRPGSRFKPAGLRRMNYAEIRANGASPRPDEACRGRLPVLGQARAGTRGQAADRRHSLHLTGLRPSPTRHAVVGFRFQGRLAQGLAVQSGRPPPPATPRCVDLDAKCVCAGQVRCRCAVERATSHVTPVRSDPRAPNLTRSTGFAGPSVAKYDRVYASYRRLRSSGGRSMIFIV